MELSKKQHSQLQFPFRKELVIILVLIIIFLTFPYFIRQADHTAAALDPGILSAIILAVAALLIFKAVTWWVIREIWPVFSEYSEHHFEANFRSLSAGHKVLVYLGFYLVILFAFIKVLEAFV